MLFATLGVFFIKTIVISGIYCKINHEYMKYDNTRNNLFHKILFVVSTVLFVQSANSQNNLARYRVVTHSSSFDANHCGHLIVDGSLDTYWESYYRKKQHSLTIDLGSEHVLDDVKIHWGSNYATVYVLSLSSQLNSDKQEIYKTRDGNGDTFSIDCKGLKARYVYLEATAVKDPIRGCVVNEIEVFGEGEKRFLPSETTTLDADHLSLDGKNWRVQNTLFLDDTPEEISCIGFNDAAWIPASVPGTVLGDYYNFGALPDPLYGDNMHQISDAFFSGNDFWYRTSVNFPAEISKQRVFLNFSGINWKSEVYFNGRYVGRIDGAFLRGEVEISDFIDFSRPNVIAVLVHHNDHWVSSTHKVIRKYLGARTTNGDVLGLDSPTCLASAGWNWLPIIKGRNNGIWNHVCIRTAGDVSVKDPWISGKLPLPDTTKAELTLHTELENHSTSIKKGKLVVTFDKLSLEYPVRLLPNETKTIVLDKSNFNALNIDNPKLWWPNGYGEARLYKATFSFMENGKISDSRTINFGIRQLDYKVEDNVLFVYCNGYRILLRGGNWGLPEAMMRMDSAAYDVRVRLQEKANFNVIRNWLGMTNHQEFYEACDRHGILIFDDFWLANPADGPNPGDHDMFIQNAKDKIKWVRKHPSLALYCGRNEGLPLLDLDTAMRHAIQKLDGTRHYIPHSAAGTVSGFGPYDVRHPRWYFENRGKTFHTELGIIAIPEVETFRKMMPEEYVWPINDMWAIHDYQQGRSEKFTQMLNARYGESTSIEAYCSKAQLQNYETSKAMMECLQSNQGGGMLLWMSQSAWPSLICQLYDYYLDYTASYFGAKKGASPILAFWDQYKNEIRVANNTLAPLRDVHLNATVHNAKGDEIWSKTEKGDLDLGTVKTFLLFEPLAASEVQYLTLELKKQGQLLIRNFYWLDNKDGNCLDLNELPVANVEMKVTHLNEKGVYKVAVSLLNTSNHIALLNRIKVKDKTTGECILPVFFDDDYVSLLPNEERTIHLSIESQYLENKQAELHLVGWNTVRKVEEL